MRCISAQRQDGIALVSVLWVVAFLSIIAAAIVTTATRSYRVSKARLDAAHSEALLDAGVTRAILGITDPDPDRRYRVDGMPYSFPFEGTELTISVQDELGKIDLNAAHGSTFERLFIAAGEAPGRAKELASRITEWRTGESALSSQSPAPTRTAGPYGSRHGPFQSVDELALVRGMTPDLFTRIEHALTVYSHRPSFDPATAPKLVLMAQAGVDSAAADRQVAERRLSAVPAASPGRAYLIHVEIAGADKQANRDQVIALTGDETARYLTYFISDR